MRVARNEMRVASMLLAGLVVVLGLCASVQAQPVRKALMPVKNVLQKCFGKDCQQTESAGVVVGQVEPDGAIVTSVGPVVDPVPSMAPSLPTIVPFPQVLEPASIVETTQLSQKRVTRQDFHKSLDSAFRSGEINIPQYLLLYGASFDREKMATIEAMANKKAELESIDAAKIDWVALLKILLPILLDLFTSKGK